MKSNYIILSYELSEELHDLFIGLISDYDFIGIEQIHDVIRVTFTEEKFTDEYANELFETANYLSDKAKQLPIVVTEEQNWNKDWEESLEPVWLNHDYVITPQWKADSLQAKNKIIINPKMSFGTGHHPTTKLIAQLALKCVKKDSFWIDAGTGTGILAIIASKLGASNVFAFDNDDWSIENIYENIILNDANNIEVAKIDIKEILIPEANGIFANLFLNLVMESFPKFYKSLANRNGDLLISGILKYDADIILKSATDNGFNLIEQLDEEEWLAFHFKPNNK